MKYDDIIHKHRPPTRHPRMKRSQRAKIFQPFAALTGYEDAINEQEQSYLTKIELSEEKEQTMNQIIACLQKGDHVSCTYFVEKEGKTGQYVTIEGIVIEVNASYRYLTINQQKIAFENLYNITKL